MRDFCTLQNFFLDGSFFSLNVPDFRWAPKFFQLFVQMRKGNEYDSQYEYDSKYDYVRQYEYGKHMNIIAIYEYDMSI